MKTIETIVDKRGLEIGALTLGDCIQIAIEGKKRVSDVVIFEAMKQTGFSISEVQKAVLDSFSHNFKALSAGLQWRIEFSLRFRRN